MLFQFCLPVALICCAPGRRTKIRNDLGGLPQEPVGDWLVWCFCPTCANCQEGRELQVSPHCLSFAFCYEIPCSNDLHFCHFS